MSLEGALKPLFLHQPRKSDLDPRVQHRIAVLSSKEVALTYLQADTLGLLGHFGDDLGGGPPHQFQDGAQQLEFVSFQVFYPVDLIETQHNTTCK